MQINVTTLGYKNFLISDDKNGLYPTKVLDWICAMLSHGFFSHQWCFTELSMEAFYILSLMENELLGL